MADAPDRLPHAALDVRGRQPKAEKIRRLLRLPPGCELKVLEIGTGSGAMAHYFATHDDLRCDVDAVDVVDQRQIREKFRFRLVEGVQLPYPAGAFDVVISNHVIEHVGAPQVQMAHLHEIARLLRPGGRAYLAFPNRWQLVEPHSHLAFLSWLPHRWRTPYLRLFRRGTAYDCEPLSLGEIERMLVSTGLLFENVCMQAIRTMVMIEAHLSWALRLVSKLPDAVLAWLRPVYPTHVYLLQALPAVRP